MGDVKNLLAGVLGLAVVVFGSALMTTDGVRTHGSSYIGPAAGFWIANVGLVMVVVAFVSVTNRD